MALVVAAPCTAASLFDDSSILEVTLQGPLSSVIKDAEDRGEQQFSLGLNGRAASVDVRVRGKSRAEHCRFPPLRLDFASKDMTDGPFVGQNKLKLVTHCGGNSRYEQNVLEEYAAYQIMNVLTDISFRVRLLRVTYVDTEKPGGDPLTRFAFVIESDEQLARRIGGETLEVRGVARTMLDESHVTLVYVFHYLIGNTDWSLVRAFVDEHCCHNGKLFNVAERTFYVPYDFDMSGLVNARYAKPQAELRLRNVRTRRYRGYCTNRETLQAALGVVRSRKVAILDVIENLPGMSEKNRLRQYRYIDKFFEAADDESKLLTEFERRCL